MNHTRSFDALGFAFELQAHDARLCSYVERLYASFPEPGSAAHHYAVENGAADLDYELRFDDDRVGDAEHPESLISTLVHDLNRRALDSSGHLILHAGGVERDGIGVVLPGEMEAGKTTLTAGLVRAGFGYLTDEGVAVDRDTLRIHPYPKPFSIDKGSWPLFPELEPDADLGTDEYKKLQWQVPPADIRADALGRPCTIALIVFPTYEEGAEMSVEPLGRAEALVELAKNTYKFDVQGAPALDVLAEIVRPASCYRLTSGDLDAAIRAVADVLAVSPSPELDTTTSIR
jgi:hypothetical protein